MTAMLEMKGVRKSFGTSGERRQVLRGVDLVLEPGRLGVVSGVSGRGKSTLLAIAGGLVAPDEGTVRVCGQDVAALDERGLDELRRSCVGFIFQTPYAIAALTARENVELALRASRRQIGDDAMRDVLERLGLAEAAELLPSQMSVGQRRRLSVARCVLAGQSLILADEPTNDLDTAGCQAVMDLLREHASRGGAVLMVTHDPRWVSLADDVFQLDEEGVVL